MIKSTLIYKKGLIFLCELYIICCEMIYLQGECVLKKKILSLLMSFCLVVCSLFSLAGCSTVKTDSTKANSGEVLKVGDITLSKADVINSFYTYYQSNSNYFSYYDEETIENSFYTWAVMKQIINEKAFDALYHPETNNGEDAYIVYTKESEKEVWESVYEYIYSQVSTYEKAIYTLNGVEKADLPLWLQTEEEEEETATEFEAYESLKPEVEEQNRDEHSDKLSEDKIKSEKVPDLEEYLFKYVSSEDEDGEDVLEDITGDALAIRNQAFAKYVENLASNAKASGKSTEKEDLMNAEVIRVYNAYYDSEVTTIFQNYYLKNQLIEKDEVALGDKAIAEAYFKKYFSDVQAYQSEDGYIATMTHKDGASLVLYNYKGRNYYFTVQHILVKYDDYITAEIKKIPGYPSGSVDYDASVNDVFAANRKELTDSYAMLTAINEDSVEQLKSINVVGNYYYYDEAFAGNASKNYGYIALEKNVDGDGNVTYERVGDDSHTMLTDEQAEDVKFMATADEIIDCYNNNLALWSERVNQYLAGDDNKKTQMEEDYEDMKYVFEVAENMRAYNKTIPEIQKKIGSLLFVELEWIYSSDSLGNKLSNKMGYMMSNYKDDNGSWVAEFAAGARAILAEVQNNGGDNSVISKTSNKIISQFGYHIIKVEDIFESGKTLVNMNGLGNVDLDNAEFVSKVVNLLKQTYVCNASNQTIYDYFYDEIYTELAGSSSSGGTYFVNLQYKWLSEYYKAGKIQYIEKMGYDELMESIA